MAASTKAPIPGEISDRHDPRSPVEALAAPEPHVTSPRLHRGYAAALAATLLLVAGVVLLLPLVLRSMAVELLGGQDGVLYDLATGQPVAAGEAAGDGTTNYLNIAVVDLDPATRTVNLAVSGNRVCAAACPADAITLLSTGDDAARRRGLSPFATIRLAAAETAFSETVRLPVTGVPTLYPFDGYRLWLGLAAPRPEAVDSGAEAPSPPAGRVVATLQNQVPQFVMAPPVGIDPRRVTAPTDPFTPLIVQDLAFRRPEYLPVLAVLLVLLIAVSGTLALVTQTIDTLVLGVGGLILGVWGVRSVMVPQPTPTVTAVDLALSGVILFLLLGLAVRAGLYFHRRSGIRLRRRRTHG